MIETKASGKRRSPSCQKKFRIPTDLVRQLKASSEERGVSESQVVCEALKQFFNPQTPDFVEMEAVLGGGIDRLRRAVATVQKDQQIATETLAQFVRLFLSNTAPPSPDEQTKLRQIAPQRFDRFIEAVRSQTKGAGYVREVLNDDSE